MFNSKTFEDYLIEHGLVEFFLLSTKLIVESAEELLNNTNFNEEESYIIKEVNLYLRSITDNFTSISCFSDTAVSLEYHIQTRRMNKVFTHRLKFESKDKLPLLANVPHFSMN